MQLPADVVRAEQTTPVVLAANTLSAAQVIVASPGAGRRLRLWMATYACFNTADVPLRVYVDIVHTTGAPVSIAHISSDGFDGPVRVFPGGFRLPTNVNLGYTRMSALANLRIVVEAWYTEENT